MVIILASSTVLAEPPTLTASSTSLVFPATPVHNSSLQQTVTLTNHAEIPIQLGAVSTTGSYVLAAALGGCLSSVGGGAGSGILLAAGASCDLFIAAHPVAIG